jgi:hypothetical protein
MPNNSTEFSEMRFRKSVRQEDRSFSMNRDMYRLFFALDENKTMSQVASQQQMDLDLLMDCVSKLWSQGLIEPIGLTNLCVDPNFVKLLKIVLYYILGRKNIAYPCVDHELAKLGLLQEQLPANRASGLIAAVSAKISDPEMSRHFRELMENLIPIRARMKHALTAGAGQRGAAASGGTRGKTRQIIDRIISARSGGNPTIAKNVKTKLILKGINPDSYFDDTLDNPSTLEQLRQMAAAMGVDLNEQEIAGKIANASKGKIWYLIIRIINERSKGNPILAKNVRTKLFLKGIDVDRYGPDTQDNPVVLDRVQKLATAMGVSG